MSDKRIPFDDNGHSPVLPDGTFVANANFIHWPHKELGKPSGKAPRLSRRPMPVSPRTGKPVKRRAPWT